MSKKRPQSLQVANTFTCASCNDGISFRPDELTMHFKIVHGGKGNPPMFPCDVCGFSTPEFTTLQQHRMQHEDCLFVVRFVMITSSKHFPTDQTLSTHHALNGQYYCPKCNSPSRRLSSLCVTHVALLMAVHRKKRSLKAHWLLHAVKDGSRRNWWRKRAHVKQDNNLSQEFKILLPKPEPHWMSPLLPFSTPGLLHDQGVLLDPEKTLEETQKFSKGAFGSGKNWPASLKGEQEFVSRATTTPPSVTS